jgi:hypothetical protein
LAEWRKRTREELTLHHDKNQAPELETDTLIATLNTLIRDTPMADEEKLVVVWTKLVELLAAIDDEAQRKLYVNRITTLLIRILSKRRGLPFWFRLIPLEVDFVVAQFST